MPTILDLLMALNRGDLPPLPAPAKPVAMPLPVGALPLTMPPDAPPDLPPTAPLPPLDLNLISQLSGPEPVAPTLQQPSTLDKVAAVLSGVALGPQYGAQLREERDRPVREYQAALERYGNRRAGAVEFATRKQEREQDRAQRQAAEQADREFNVWVKRTGVTDDMAKEQLRQAFEIQKIREQERIADERQATQLKAAQEKERRKIEDELAGTDGAPPNIAKEISEYRVGLRPGLSAAAEKWRGLRARKLAAQLARVSGGGGGTGGGPVMARLQDGQLVPASLVNREIGGVMLNGQLIPVVEYVGGKIPARPQQQTAPLRVPDPAEFDTANVFNLAPVPKSSAPSDDEVKAYAKRFKMSPKKARAELMGQ